MTIPTTDEFASWLLRSATPLDLGIPPPKGITVHSVANYLLETDEARIRMRDALVKEDTFRWLSSQREYQRAAEKVFGKRGRAAKIASERTPVPAVDTAAKFLERAAAQWKSRGRTRVQGDEYFGTIRADLARFTSRGFETTWDWRTMEAVAEYLEGKTARRFQDAVNEIDAAAAAAYTAFVRYQALVEELKKPNLRSIPVNRFHLRTHLNSWNPTAMLGIVSPLGRKDSTSDERLFVYRMFTANRRSARSAKAEAIAELMGLEGFRHQYEVRTIERLCAGFAKLAAPFSRTSGEPTKETVKSPTSSRGNTSAIRAA